MDDCNTASELVKKVTILDAISWMKASWEDLSTDTIKKCFTHCGFNYTRYAYHLLRAGH